MDKITKLSQAIRLGATFRPQQISHITNAERTTSCALMAAYEAVFGISPKEFCDYPIPTFIDLRDRLGIDKNSGVFCRVMNMNNHEHMSREAIADTLEAEGL